MGSARNPERNLMQKCVGFFFVGWFLQVAGKHAGAMGPGLRRGDELGRFADVTEVPGSFVSYRQASYLGSARNPEKTPMQKCVGFFFVWWFLTVAGKHAGVMGPGLRRGDELGRFAEVTGVPGSFVNYRQ